MKGWKIGYIEPNVTIGLPLFVYQVKRRSTEPLPYETASDSRVVLRLRQAQVMFTICSAVQSSVVY